MAKLTGKTAKSILSLYEKELSEEDKHKLLVACENDEEIFAKVMKFGGLIRDDSYGRAVVIHAGSVFVTAGDERRKTGTHTTGQRIKRATVQVA